MKILSMPISGTKAKVVGSYLDDTLITDTTLEVLPSPEVIFGKSAVLYINPQTNELFYEYEDRELTAEEKQIQIEQNQAQIILALVQGGLL